MTSEDAADILTRAIAEIKAERARILTYARTLRQERLAMGLTSWVATPYSNRDRDDLVERADVKLCGPSMYPYGRIDITTPALTVLAGWLIDNEIDAPAEARYARYACLEAIRKGDTEAALAALDRHAQFTKGARND